MKEIKDLFNEIGDIGIIGLKVYIVYRKFLEETGREKTLTFLKLSRPSFDDKRFYMPKYQKMSYRDLAWEIAKDIGELNEDFEALKTSEKLRDFEEKNNLDLYKLLRDVDF